ncbi:ribosome small subunit-dependent GTPase A [Paraliomyxa miuraensis]|uniref:ribosome small subunit-dependent GTPase A n=1 Tax=Paraliomyxa miuraensis TaxID=376150 RepID=UPI0022510C60|nr:ribosome small subunit-dependent GTPase A [Paraliomyxa miuraensis]MCX4244122.1 ribosome small subunit-dependent GTPase A [Paraliomyxa miuraensis]
MQLEILGWTPSLAAAFEAVASPSSIPARLVRIEGKRALASTAFGERFVDFPSRLRRGEGVAVVGDWVSLAAADSARVEHVLPRQTVLARRAAGRRVRRQLLAANVDVVFVVSSLDADFSERRLERYLTVVHDGGARPVILLTKAGPCDDPAPLLARARAVAPGVDVHAIDVLAGIGPNAPRAHLAPGRTAVLVGSSGVGKSTLLNHLMGQDLMLTGAVRQSDGLGQHTTSHRELFVLPQGGVVIDTPGLRELAPWADEDALEETFADVEALAAHCRFANCAHEHEPGCAVLEAVDAGTLDPARLAAFVSLRHELQLTGVQRHEQRRRDRSFAKLARGVQRLKRGRR